MPEPSISLLAALILGVVEGLTEYLPISSTGHLILAARFLGLPQDDPGVNAFVIVIQGGAILAVLGLYRADVARMLRGLVGRDPVGLRLFQLLIVSFLPAAACAFVAGDFIKERLFNAGAVAAALAAGGVAMILLDLRDRSLAAPPNADAKEPHAALDPAAITFRMAFLIGLGQCLALWPGTSRAMVTIVAAMLVGMNKRQAAEYSFLLALPTLGAATLHDLLGEREHLIAAAGPAGLAIGAVVSCIVAALAIKFFLSFLTRRGLAPFGWYRIALAAAVLLLGLTG